jgi:hypothetical protein
MWKVGRRRQGDVIRRPLTKLNCEINVLVELEAVRRYDKDGVWWGILMHISGFMDDQRTLMHEGMIHG